MVENGGMIISIIGARNSGKTNYITTLINELTHKGHYANVGIYPTVVGRTPDEHTKARYKNDFFNVLYKNNTCPIKTEPTNERNKIPLMYKLFSTNLDKHIYLVLYDTAGENFEVKKNIEENAIFLKNSDAIIMLLDTFGINEVHHTLKSKLNLGNIETNFDTIINTIIAYFDEQTNRKDFYKKPLALTFSKIDAIIEHDEKFAHLPNFNTNSQYFDGTGIDLSVIESIDMGMKECLREWGEGGFIQNINAPAHFNGKATLFGISALGKAPTTQNTVTSITPYRVLDPLIWILHQLKFPLPIKKR